MNDQQLLRYSRHILLNELGIEGQQKLLDAVVGVVGCGGLGSAALPILAAAGVGKLIIADGDRVDETNLQRQTAYRETDIGSLKTTAMAAQLAALNSGCRIITQPEKLDGTGLLKLAHNVDVLLDCSDNYATRQALNAAALAAKKPLVSGAAVQFDGQLAVYRADLGGSEPCYACLFDSPTANDAACATFGVFAPVVAVIGAMQAAETLKLLTGLPVQSGSLNCYSALSGQWQNFRFVRNPSCHACGDGHTPVSGCL